MIRGFLATSTLLIGLFVALLAPLPGTAVAATDVLGNACNGAGADSALCRGRTNQDPLTGPNGVLSTATSILAWVAGAAAVIFMVIGGIKYITAAGAPAEVQKAKDTIIYAIIGIIAIVLARQVITFVLSKL